MKLVPGTRVTRTGYPTPGTVAIPPRRYAATAVVFVRWDNLPVARGEAADKLIPVPLIDAHEEACHACDGTGDGGHHDYCASCAGVGRRPTCDHCGGQDDHALRNVGRCSCRDFSPGERVEYTNSDYPSYVGKRGTVRHRTGADGKYVKVIWDDGRTGWPPAEALRRVPETPIVRRTPPEVQAYLEGFKAGGRMMDRCFTDKQGVPDTLAQARLQFNALYHIMEGE